MLCGGNSSRMLQWLMFHSIGLYSILLVQVVIQLFEISRSTILVCGNTGMFGGAVNCKVSSKVGITLNHTAKKENRTQKCSWIKEKRADLQHSRQLRCFTVAMK